MVECFLQLFDLSDECICKEPIGRVCIEKEKPCSINNGLNVIMPSDRTVASMLSSHLLPVYFHCLLGL